jgi:glycosyltransferase involved in cell wall biosynthesis
MKIVMFTPGLRKSAIGRMVKLVTSELVELGHEVTIIRTENETLLEQPAHHFDATLIPWNSTSEVNHAATFADIVIYHIGDNCSMHRGCMEWLPHFPGIVCLHDIVLTNLLFIWSETPGDLLNTYLYSSYGRQMPSNAPVQSDFEVCAQDLETFTKDLHIRVPFTEWICSRALGVVTHSSWGIQPILNSCPGPVYVLPLPYTSVGSKANKPASQPLRKKNTFDILTFGHINPNKRAASVITALGNSSCLRSKARYRLIGFIEPRVRQELEALAQKHKVNLVISGEVDDPTLAQAITEADVIACLRLPCLEAASASAIASMLSSKPLIVHDHGFYRDLPDSCVKKIQPADEINTLQTALEELYKDPEKGISLGLAAHTFAEKTFRADHYAEKLVDLACAVNKAKPLITTVNLFTDMLHRWGASRQLHGLKETLEPLQLFEEIL